MVLTTFASVFVTFAVAGDLQGRLDGHFQVFRFRSDG